MEASPCINQHVNNYPASRKIVQLWLQYAAITCMCYIQFNTTVVPFHTSPRLEHRFQVQSNIVCYGYLGTKSLQFIKYTLVYNRWQIRKTAIVAEISSTAVYRILSVCVTLSMPWTRAIRRYTAVQGSLIGIGDAASRHTLLTIWISHTGLPTLKQR